MLPNIRLYDPPVFGSEARNLILGAAVCIFCGLWNCLLEYLSGKYGAVHGLSRWVRLGNIDKFPILLAAVLIFAGFRKLSVPHSKVINTLASATFGVYLIHTNGLLKIFIWHRILRCDFYADSPFYPLFIIISVLLVFIVCAAVDLLVWRPFEKFLARSRRSRGAV